jgi:hypothetical protein
MSPNEPDVVVWSRDDARQWQRYQSFDDVIPSPLLEATLPLAILYDGIDLRPAFPPSGRELTRTARFGRRDQSPASSPSKSI